MSGQLPKSLFIPYEFSITHPQVFSYSCYIYRNLISRNYVAWFLSFDGFSWLFLFMEINLFSFCIDASNYESYFSFVSGTWLCRKNGNVGGFSLELFAGKGNESISIVLIVKPD